MNFLTEKDKRELEELFKKTFYEKISKTKNPDGLESLDEILRETIAEMDINIDKILNDDSEYFAELTTEFENILLKKVSNAENLAKIMEEENKSSK